MGEGDGKSRRRGDAQSPSSGFPRHIPHSSRRAPRGCRTTSGRRVRRCRACAGFSAPISCSASCPSAAWVVRGARGAARRDLRSCPCLPPRTCHETRASEDGNRNGPRPNVSVRSESAPVRGWRDRQTSALKTLILRYVPTRALTSVSGCTPPRTSDASPAVPPATPVGEDLIHPRRWIHSRLPPL